MHEGTVERLNLLKEKIIGIIEEDSEQLLDSTHSVQLKDDLQRLIINSLNTIPDNVEIIIDDIDNEYYEEASEPDDDIGDY